MSLAVLHGVSENTMEELSLSGKAMTWATGSLVMPFTELGKTGKLTEFGER